MAMNQTAPLDLKRTFDLAASAVGLIIAIPPIIAASVAMTFIHKNSPIFTQTRIGWNGTPFKIYKIRTMRDEFNEQGLLLPPEARTSPLGRFLRKSRIDELPQLFNILKGDMSLVGPRPILDHEFKAKDPVRITVRPGLTGLSQISHPHFLSHEQMLELDQEYVRNHTFLGDLKIILKTPFSLIQDRNAPHYRQDREITRHV